MPYDWQTMKATLRRRRSGNMSDIIFNKSGSVQDTQYCQRYVSKGLNSDDRQLMGVLLDECDGGARGV